MLQHARFFDHSSFTSLGYPPCHECVPKFKNSLVCSEINSTFSPNIKSSTSHHGIKVCMRKLPCCHCQQSIQTLGTHFLLTRYSVPLECNFLLSLLSTFSRRPTFKYAVMGMDIYSNRTPPCQFRSMLMLKQAGCSVTCSNSGGPVWSPSTSDVCVFSLTCRWASIVLLGFLQNTPGISFALYVSDHLQFFQTPPFVTYRTISVNWVIFTVGKPKDSKSNTFLCSPTSIPLISTRALRIQFLTYSSVYPTSSYSVHGQRHSIITSDSDYNYDCYSQAIYETNLC